MCAAKGKTFNVCWSKREAKLVILQTNILQFSSQNINLNMKEKSIRLHRQSSISHRESSIYVFYFYSPDAACPSLLLFVIWNSLYI